MKINITLSLQSVFRNLPALGYLHNAKRVKLHSHKTRKSHKITKTYALKYLLESTQYVNYRYDGQLLTLYQPD